MTDESQREELRAIQKIARQPARTHSNACSNLPQKGMDAKACGLDVNLIINDVILVTVFAARDDAEASGIAIDVVKDLVPVPAIMGQPSACCGCADELIEQRRSDAFRWVGDIAGRSRSGSVQIVITDQGEGMDAATQTPCTRGALYDQRCRAHRSGADDGGKHRAADGRQARHRQRGWAGHHRDPLLSNCR